MSGLLSLKWNNHSSVFLNLLQILRVKELYCDTTIVCHGKFYPVHKLVLSTCSEYFEDIFEITECKHPFIIMKDVEPIQLEALLNYMYKGEVNVLQDSLPGLIKAAEALKIKGLAVPDDDLNSIEASPISKRKRNTTTLPHVTGMKKSRMLENIKETNLSKENICKISTDRQSKLDCLPSIEENNSCSQYSRNYGDDSSSELIQDDHSDYNIQSSVKLEPTEDEESSHSEVLTEEEPSVFASFLPRDDVCDENGERNSTEPTSSDTLSLPIYQECFSETSTNLANSLDMSWSTEKACTSNNQENDGGSQVDCTIPMTSAMTSLLANWPSVTQTPVTGDCTDGEIKLHKCCLCSFTTKWKSNLRIHFQRAHTLEKPYHCTFCSYKACSSDSLKRHVRTHTGEKPYQCPICPHRTAVHNNLKRHIRRQHTGTDTSNVMEDGKVINKVGPVVD